MGQNAEYLTPSELSKRWGGAVTKGTLANWRSKRKGPPFVKFGHSVRYRVDQVIGWEEQNMHLVGANDNAKGAKQNVS